MLSYRFDRELVKETSEAARGGTPGQADLAHPPAAQAEDQRGAPAGRGPPAAAGAALAAHPAAERPPAAARRAPAAA